MKLSSRVGVVLGTVTFAATMTAMGLPAQAPSGTGWREVFVHHYGAPADVSGFTAVIAPGRHDAWAFGGTNLSISGSPVAERWTGGRWRASPLPGGLDSTINAASAVSASDIWAVTFYGGDILHWNGRRWSVAKHLSGSGELTGIAAVSAKDVWVFGASGAIGGLGTWHFNGHGWKKVTGNGSAIAAASALSATSIWAISGAPLQSVILHYNGTRWRQLTARPLAGVAATGVLPTSPKDVWVSGTTGSSHITSWLIHLSGRQWTRIKVPWPVAGLGHLIPDGQGGLWAAAESNSGSSLDLHLSRSGRWSRIAAPGGAGFGIEAQALIPGTTSVWAVGATQGTTGTDAVIWGYGPDAIPPPSQ
ncbi:MAG: hypothetical protein ABSB01_16275 [Streptosporangiaceae bacterium]|jgi:hypothetical protein